MNLLATLILSICWITFSYGQELTPFSNIEERTEVSGLAKAVEFDPNTEYFNTISASKSPQLSVDLPFFNSSTINLELIELDIFSPQFELIERSENGDQLIPYKPGYHFYGQVGNDHSTHATFSIYDDGISGIIRYKGKTYNFGSIRNSSKHILYEVDDFQEDFVMQCETIGETSMVDRAYDENKSSGSCTTPTEIYFECDYDMFLNFGDVTSTSDYLSSVFVEVAAIYDAENIPLQISQIVVWSTDDPYTDNVNGISDFATDLNNSGFVGDLAHLVTNDAGGNGGIAFLDMLCGANPYAYSDIVNSSQPYPTYSWDVQVIAHEIGHNFGSPHTHECVWGPNGDEQIDDCGNTPSNAGPCYDQNNEIIPPTGGTIMSYCHLDAVGINFSNGFGVEPGDLIREKYEACKCDNATCETAKEITQGGTFTSEPDHGFGASNSNATHAEWFKYTPQEDGTIDLQSCMQGEDTRVWIHTGTCSNLVFEAISDDNCDMGNGSNYASEIIDFAVTSGTTYYIEWDDRWSTGEFDWVKSFTATMDSCDAENLSVSGMIQDSIFHAEVKLDSDGTIMSGYQVVFKAGNELELMPGFESEMGAVLDVMIENCENN